MPASWVSTCCEPCSSIRSTVITNVQSAKATDILTSLGIGQVGVAVALAASCAFPQCWPLCQCCPVSLRTLAARDLGVLARVGHHHSLVEEWNETETEVNPLHDMHVIAAR